nr:chromosome segregation protein SMC [Bombilactobacillus apium]
MALQINGFKSFGEKTKFHFEPGITGIIGPNGSGKSNVIDAIRWVMGEQSAKNLRGEKMQDIIFAGSSSKAAVNRAEVLLQFDNHDRRIALNRDQVEVRRRLFRNGTSEFLINNQKVRLKDVTDLFLDSGLGRHSLAIISQGQVEAIFNSNPVERRSIIEEPAGVAHFRLRKQEAQQQLEQTDANLYRVADITQELARQVEPLKQQASLARDYQTQKKQFAELEQNILAVEIQNLAQQKEDLAQKNQRLTRQKQAVQERVQADQTAVTENRTQSQQLTSAIDTQQEQLTNLSRQLEVLKGQQALAIERSDFNSNNQQQLRVRCEKLQQQAQKTRQTRQQQAAQITATSEQLAKLELDLKQIQADFTNDPEQIATKIKTLQATYIELVQQQTSQKNQQEYLTVQLDHEQKSAQQLQEKVQLQEERVRVQADQVQTLQKQGLVQQKEVQQAQTEHQQQVTKTQRNSQQVQSYQREYYGQLQKLQQLQANQRSLQQVIEQHQGFYQGVRAILSAPQLRGIVGVLADLIQVPERYQVALQSAAGAQLQSIVTVDQTAARQAITFLRQHKAGRATFLPRSVIKSRRLNESELRNLKAQDYFLGLASDLIQAPSELQAIVEHIFGRLLVVQDMKAAVVASNLSQQRFRIVTLQGDLINPGGAMTGGQVKTKGALLSQHSQLDHLTESLQVAQKQLVAVKKQWQEAQSKQEQLQRQTELAQQSLQKAIQEQQERSGQFKFQQQELQTLQKQAEELQAAVQANKNKQQQLEQQAQQSSEQQTHLQQKITQNQAQLKQQQALLTDFDEQERLYQRQVQHYQTQITLTKKELQNEQKLAQYSQTELEQQEEQVRQLMQQLQQLNSDHNQLATSHQDVQKQITELQGQVTRLREKLQEQQQDRQELLNQASALAQHLQQALAQQAQAGEEQETVAIELATQQSQLSHKVNQLEQNYHLSYEAALQQVPQQDWSLEKAQSQVKLLKLGLDDLGPVNLAAIEDYEQVKERYDFLQQQQEDLLTARKQLTGTIHEMDQEVSRRFQAMFEQVAAAFAKIFPQMFGGGKARLILTDEHDLLNSGIEIIAQPPGKKFRQLSLLSGGERALTAITLLFAILKVQPVPFCVLDEAEASLDDANVERFANYLRHYDDQTQFIIITHRKGTMMHVKRLYGITMQDYGVSKVVTTQLNLAENEVS